VRALILATFCATAICGVKGAPQPPVRASLVIAAAPDAGATNPISADLLNTNDSPESIWPALDAGCSDAGP
jgi:hypothetical protein